MQATIRDIKAKNRIIRVLSYNVLAQSLAKRERYPTNGQCIKWGFRSKAFGPELAAYSPDIAVFQEVDVYLKEWWLGVLKNLGMDAWFQHTPGKRHGLLIAWLRNKFVPKKKWHLDFDNISEPISQVETGNLAALIEFEDYHGTFLVATTHLYWHPDADYERARQMLCLLKAIEGFSEVIVAGDFNSTPDSAAYLLATGKKLTESAKNELRRSANTKGFGLDISPTSAPQANARMSKLADPERALSQILEAKPLTMISAYDPVPEFTTWTDDFKATLDYILIKGGCVTVRELLTLPSSSDISGSLPRGGYPSDHLCLMATIMF